jgi:hypothetical protein
MRAVKARLPALSKMGSIARLEKKLEKNRR